jgi:mevalonate kinase
MPATKVRGEAPGKLILFGEHAVVYGAPALGMPLSRPAVAELSPGSGQVSLRLAKGLQAEASPHAAQPTDLVARVLGPRLATLDVRLTLHFPPMSGFGSSAALVVALLRALEVLEGKPPAPPRRLLARTMDAEAVAHAKPSGVDPAICLWAAPIRFQRDGERMKVKALKVATPATLVVGAAGAHGGTRQTVSRLAELRETDGGLIQSAMGTLGAASEAGERALARGELPRLGRAMDVAQGVLSGLGLVQAPVHDAVQLAKAAGALGAKMSGAGGAGGAFYAVFADAAGARRAVKVLAERGIPAWLEALG